MVDTTKLKGIIVMCGLTQEKVARHIGITPKTFYSKMKKGEFGSDEIMAMMELLSIDDPVPIFFVRQATCQVAEG